MRPNWRPDSTCQAVQARTPAARFDLKVSALPELPEAGIGRFEGTADPAVRIRTAEVLRAWVVEQDLYRRVADGETGQQVLDRMTAACALGPQVWGSALPHADLSS
ncbi:MAG: histidine phosphatase family protein [Actinobacteria bacterium]|nr:histidine phosphatase family protein [Actinomycetota bacterium]